MKQDNKFSQAEWEKRIEAKTGHKVSPQCPLCAGKLWPLVMGHEVVEHVQVPVVHEGRRVLAGVEFRVLVCSDCGTMQKVSAAACTVEQRIQVADVLPPSRLVQ
jgi:hypothetical protein